MRNGGLIQDRLIVETRMVGLERRTLPSLYSRGNKVRTEKKAKKRVAIET